MAALTRHFSRRSRPTSSDADKVLCVTAVSPSLAPEELADVRDLARRVVAASPRGRDERACESGLHGERRLTLRALQRRAARRRRSACRERRSDRRPRGEHRRPGGPPTRSASGVERGAVFPLVDAGFSKDEVRTASKALGSANLGQARRCVPCVADSLRHTGHRADTQGRGDCRVRSSCSRFSRAASASLRRTRADRARRRRPRRCSFAGATRLSLLYVPPVTAMSPWTSRGSGRAT